jgi:predicted methyltransferase
VNVDCEQLLIDTAVAARLKEGRAGVERVLAAVYNTPGMTSRELAAHCRLPTPTVSAVRKEMIKAGLLIAGSTGAHLSALGQQIVHIYALHLTLAEHGASAYGRFARHALFPLLVEQMRGLLAERPSADTTLDQAKCLPETVAARALLALEYGVLAGRRIALIGDDDFTSIGLAVLGSLVQREGAQGPTLITVLDIDQRVLAGIKRLADQLGFTIQTLHHDLRYPIPQDLLRTHHAFFTDPPYTIPGAALFVARGLEMCKAGCIMFLSFANKGPYEMLAVQQDLLRKKLLIREIFPGFNRYEGGSLWGNQTQMLVCECVELTAFCSEPYTGFMYTADFRKSRPLVGGDS